MLLTHYKNLLQAGKILTDMQTGGTPPLDTYVSHEGDYSGAFILFGGWTKVYDHTIKKGTRGHELYCAMGGVGAGGWKGSCSIELTLPDGSLSVTGPDGKNYLHAKYLYDKDGNVIDTDKIGRHPTWEEIQTGWKYFHDHVKSFMYLAAEQFGAPFPIFVMFNGSSNTIGGVVPKAALSAALGGGTVKVES